MKKLIFFRKCFNSGFVEVSRLNETLYKSNYFQYYIFINENRSTDTYYYSYHHEIFMKEAIYILKNDS